MSVEAWLKLCISPGIGTAGTHRLLESFGSAEAIVRASAQQLSAAGLPRATITALGKPDDDALRRATDWLNQEHHHLVTCADESYPQLLLETGQAPPCLFVAGNLAALTLPQLAIVGSRNATPGGLETARAFATLLATGGLTITSGLATGIDTAAHRGALDADGLTIAVLGTGPDIVYPRENQKLAEEICCNGALVSEFPPGTEPRRDHFPRRNRLMSGLSLGTLVVEAGVRSGALITARHSGDYGREVFAVPGSIHSPLSKGCHRLIRQGAKLVETGQDIIEELGSLAGSLESQPALLAEVQKSPVNIDPAYDKLLSSMGYDPVSVAQLTGRSGLTTEELCSMLLILELEGKVDSLAGGRFQQRNTVD
jgi:DNA processing protein